MNIVEFPAARVNIKKVAQTRRTFIYTGFFAARVIGQDNNL